MITVCRKTTPELTTRKPVQNLVRLALVEVSFSPYWGIIKPGARGSRVVSVQQVQPQSLQPPPHHLQPYMLAICLHHIGGRAQRFLYIVRLLFRPMDDDMNYCSNSFCKWLDLTFSRSTVCLAVEPLPLLKGHRCGPVLGWFVVLWYLISKVLVCVKQ